MPHPQPTAHRGADGVVRFRANAMVQALMAHHPREQEEVLADETLDLDDRSHFAKLLGFSVDEIRGRGLDPGPVRMVASGKQPRHPVQPLVFDPHGVVRFKANAAVKALLYKDSPLDLNQMCLMGFGKEDWDQFGQIIGYSHGGSPSYISTRSLNASEREWEDRQHRVALEQAQARAEGLEAAFPAANTKPRAIKPRV